MGTPYLGETRLVSFNFPPKGWAFCNGQILSISQNQALFALLGTTYGGNGVQTFALPNLQGRAPIHFGNGFVQGISSGEATHTLVASEMPTHTHVISGRPTASTADPTGAMWAGSAKAGFAAATNQVAMAPAAITTTGGGQPHDNMPPYLVLNWVIALQGIFPSRN
jgi:microcystin-dependent protein